MLFSGRQALLKPD